MPIFNIKKRGKDRTKNRRCSYETIDEDDLPKLHSLVLKNASTSKLKSQIAQKVANINEKDKHGRTALHYAASIDNEKIVYILLQCGLTIDIDAKDNDGKTALYKAVEVFSANCVHILVEHGATTDVWDNNESTPLHIATVNRKTIIISILISGHGNPSIRDKMGFTPLHVASAFGYLETAKELIDHGADMNAKDSLGRTPLMAAACEGTSKMVRLLLENGADLTMKDNFYHNAIDHSKQNPSESMTKIIQEAAAQRTLSKISKTEANYEDGKDRVNENAVDDSRSKINKESKTEKEVVVKQLGMDPVETSSSKGEEDITKVETSSQDVDTESRKGGSSMKEAPNSQIIVEEVLQFVDVDVTQNIPCSTDESHKENLPGRYLAEKTETDELDADLSKNGRIDNDNIDMSPLHRDSLQILKKKNASKIYEQQKKIRFSADHKENKDGTKLLLRTKQLKEENTRLRRSLSELLRQTRLERNKEREELQRERSQLQYINLKNKRILEEKLNQCARLEKKLNEAHIHLVSEIEKTKDGANLDDVSKRLIKELNKKLRFSDAKIDHLTIQLKSSRKEKVLLETEVKSFKEEIIILKEIIAKREAEQKYFDDLKIDSIDFENEALDYYEDEVSKRESDNEVLRESLNKLRKENAMLKEQHLCNKHETQMINNELNEANERIVTLQHQLTNIKNQQMTSKEMSYRNLISRDRESCLDGLKIHPDDLRRVKCTNIERAKSDSTIYGFNAFNSATDMLNYKEKNFSKESTPSSHAAYIAGIEYRPNSSRNTEIHDR